MVFLLKLTICWGFFALLYTLLLRSETFFHSNRLYLLTTVLTGIVLAAVGDQLLTPIQEDVLPMITLPVVSADFQQVAEVSQQMGSADYLWLIYFLGAACMLLRTGWGITRLMQMATRGSSDLLPEGGRLIHSSEVQTPFSFFKWIFVPVDWDRSPDAAARYMLAHERAHAAGWHSVDIMLMECLSAVFWFHPLVYWYRRSLRVVHEYLADAQASSLTDKKQYGLLLIRQSQSGMPVAFANHFFQSPLKQRLIMLMKQHSAPVRALRYGLVLPLAGLFALLFQQAPAIAKEVDLIPGTMVTQTEMQEAAPALVVTPPTTSENAVLKNKDCNQPPAYPGGMEALGNFMGKNLQYPTAPDGAVKEGIVHVAFTIKEDGSIQNVYVKNPAKMPAVFEAEAMRVVSMMPKWTPGQKDCKAANYELTLPIQFKKDSQPASKADQVMNVPDTQTPPHYTGGQEELIKYLIANVKYPATAKQAKAEGMVIVKFIVEKDGNIGNVEAHDTNGIHADIVAEAIRVVQTMPKWVPGVVDGAIVRVQFALPIRFKLD